MYKPNCRVCLDPLRDDGSCRNRCDPALARPGKRAGAARRAAAKPDNRIPKFTTEEKARAIEILRGIDPVFRFASDKGRAASPHHKKIRNG